MRVGDLKKDFGSDPAMVMGYSISTCRDDYSDGGFIYVRLLNTYSEAPFPETLEEGVLGPNFKTTDSFSTETVTINGYDTFWSKYGSYNDPDEPSKWVDGDPDGDWLGSDYYMTSVSAVYTEPPEAYRQYMDDLRYLDWWETQEAYAWDAGYVDATEYQQIVNGAAIVGFCTPLSDVTIEDLPPPTSDEVAGSQLHANALTLESDGTVKDTLASAAIVVADVVGDGLSAIDAGLDTVINPIISAGIAATTEFQEEMAAVAEIGDFGFYLFTGFEFKEAVDGLTGTMLSLRRELAAYGEQSIAERQARLEALNAALSGTKAPGEPLTTPEREELERERAEIIDFIKGDLTVTGVRGVARYESGIPAQELEAAGFITSEFLKGEVLTARIADGGQINFEALWSNVLGGTVTLDGDRSVAIGTEGADRIALAPGTLGQVQLAGGDDWFMGGLRNDAISGGDGHDTLHGGDGADTLNGGSGDDEINGGETDTDRRDVVFAGDGNDRVNAGYGNDLVYGMDGDDTIAGGFGADELLGQNGNDVITGSGLSDLVFGGAGDDFVNGGFGYDRINGGTGADKFFHLGVFDHGSDWVQDYNSAEGDVLLFGDASASHDQFQVNFTHTANTAGERSGDDAVEEAFVIYRPTGQIMWALIDGGGEDEINLKIADEVFDLLG